MTQADIKAGMIATSNDGEEILKVIAGTPYDEDCFCGIVIGGNNPKHIIGEYDNCWGIKHFTFSHPDTLPEPTYTEAEVCGFLEWVYDNRWFNKEGDKWHYTFEMGTSISKATLEKHYRKTTQQLLDIYKNRNNK